jgi:hypothetical protein
MGPRRLPVNSRKLLVAAIGVAAVSYVGCTSALQENPTSGNLMSYPADSGPETGSFPTSGNLMAPDATVVDSGDGGAGDAGDDAGDAGDAADAAND